MGDPIIVLIDWFLINNDRLFISKANLKGLGKFNFWSSDLSPRERVNKSSELNNVVLWAYLNISEPLIESIYHIHISTIMHKGLD